MMLFSFVLLISVLLKVTKAAEIAGGDLEITEVLSSDEEWVDIRHVEESIMKSDDEDFCITLQSEEVDNSTNVIKPITKTVATEPSFSIVPFDWTSFDWIESLPGFELLHNLAFKVTDPKKAKKYAIIVLANFCLKRWDHLQHRKDFLHGLGKELYRLLHLRKFRAIMGFFRKYIGNDWDDRKKIISLLIRYTLVKHKTITKKYCRFLISMNFTLEDASNLIPFDEETFPILKAYLAQKTSTRFFDIFVKNTVESTALMAHVNVDLYFVPDDYMEWARDAFVFLLANQPQSFFEPEDIAEYINEAISHICTRLRHGRSSLIRMAYYRGLDYLNPSKKRQLCADTLKAAFLGPHRDSEVSRITSQFLDDHGIDLAQIDASFVDWLIGVASRNKEVKKALLKAEKFCSQHLVFSDAFPDEASLISTGQDEKLILSGESDLEYFSTAVLPALLLQKSNYSIDLQLFLKAVGNDEYFAAIKENPEVLNMVDFSGLSFPDLLLLSPYRRAELGALNNVFCFESKIIIRCFGLPEHGCHQSALDSLI